MSRLSLGVERGGGVPLAEVHWLQKAVAELLILRKQSPDSSLAWFLLGSAALDTQLGACPFPTHSAVSCSGPSKCVALKGITDSMDVSLSELWE